MLNCNASRSEWGWSQSLLREAAFVGLVLHERVGLDTGKSVVLYDQNFVFNFALEGLPNERVMRAPYDRTPIRYWSRGV
jgi:hypothetical protein